MPIRGPLTITVIISLAVAWGASSIHAGQKQNKDKPATRPAETGTVQSALKKLYEVPRAPLR